ncbi:unnamed protein product, partial [marine sediment metagenome]
ETMKDHIPLKTRFGLIQVACLILFLLAAQGWARKNELSVSRVDPSMGQFSGIEVCIPVSLGQELLTILY